MVRIEKPLPIRLEDTVCLEEGRAPGPSPLAMVLKDTAGTSGVSRVHVQERGLRGEAEEQGQPRRFMSGRCTTQTDWKDDQQGNLKEVCPCTKLLRALGKGRMKWVVRDDGTLGGKGMVRSDISCKQALVCAPRST